MGRGCAAAAEKWTCCGLAQKRRDRTETFLRVAEEEEKKGERPISGAAAARRGKKKGETSRCFSGKKRGFLEGKGADFLDAPNSGKRLIIDAKKRERRAKSPFPRRKGDRNAERFRPTRAEKISVYTRRQEKKKAESDSIQQSKKGVNRGRRRRWERKVASNPPWKEKGGWTRLWQVLEKKEKENLVAALTASRRKKTTAYIEEERGGAKLLTTNPYRQKKKRATSCGIRVEEEEGGNKGCRTPHLIEGYPKKKNPDLVHVKRRTGQRREMKREERSGGLP